VPTYVFGCEKCGEFDARRRMADRGEPAECPTCGKICQRVFCGPGVILIPPRLHYKKGGVRDVTGGHSMNDIRHNAELRRDWLK